MQTIANLILFTCFCLLANDVDALQEFDVKDGSTIQVNISSRELTRFAIEGEGRLEKLWGAAGVVEVQPDLDNGEVFIRPLPGSLGVISFFLSDNGGSTYTVIATQKNIPSETVLLSPRVVKISPVEEDRYRSLALVERVKLLMKGMANREPVPGFYKEVVAKEIPLWRETKITLKSSFQSIDILGELYVVENISSEPLILHEREFLDFGESVLATALDALVVEPGHSTSLYIARRLKIK